MKLVVLFVLSLAFSLGHCRRRLSGFALAICHLKCSLSQFNCNCEMNSSVTDQLPRVCIPRTSLCDGWQDCEDGSDEIDCTCPPDQYQCGCDVGGNCFANAVYECKGPDDESTCNSMKNINGTCTTPPVPCDGVVNCPWAPIHDEMNCPRCPPERPNRCDCNAEDGFSCNGGAFTCFSDNRRCNRKIDCSDSSDEVGCACLEDEFKCQCYRKNPVTCPIDSACVPKDHISDGVKDCLDGSDETPFHNVIHSRFGNVSIWRFKSMNQCHNTPMCNVSSCYTTLSLECNTSDCSATEMLCTSTVKPNVAPAASSTSFEVESVFQCRDGSLHIVAQFCDNVVDCADDSDEVKNQPGFKCLGPVGNCVLPQRNLYDNVSQCADGSDLCFDGFHKCFQCIDKRMLISSKQVCDGVVDCYDASDECLCPNGPRLPQCIDLAEVNTLPHLVPALEGKSGTRLIDDDIQFRGNIFEGLNVSIILCQTKWGQRTAVMCDGRPECRDFTDECNCNNPPSFCDDPCHNFYPLGDRYCDGLMDQAWIYINDSACPRGFDELLCPKRFVCMASGRISIDLAQVCDGTKNCDDGTDEVNCPSTTTMPNKVALTTGGATAVSNFASLKCFASSVLSVYFTIWRYF